MGQVEILRSQIMSKLISISDEEYLKALLKLMDSSLVRDEKVKLTKRERAGIEEGLRDYEEGRILTQEEVHKRDDEWLNEP